jgi:hypothetical protein
VEQCVDEGRFGSEGENGMEIADEDGGPVGEVALCTKVGEWSFWSAGSIGEAAGEFVAWRRKKVVQGSAKSRRKEVNNEQLTELDQESSPALLSERRENDDAGEVVVVVRELFLRVGEVSSHHEKEDSAERTFEKYPSVHSCLLVASVRM